MNSGEIDVSNDKGKQLFELRFLSWPDNAFKSKGYWCPGNDHLDPEGEEFPERAITCDPRLVPTLLRKWSLRMTARKA